MSNWIFLIFIVGKNKTQINIATIAIIDKIIIPFTDNPAVTITQNTKYYLKIININNNEIIKTIGPLTRKDNESHFIDNAIYFNLSTNTVTANTYYKIQLGY